MGYRVYFGAGDMEGTEYDALKHTLVIDEVLGEGSSATLSAKGVTCLTGLMPIKVCCNTTSSITFGGIVRNWSMSRKRSSDAVTYEIEVDDWRTYFNKGFVRGAFTSVAIDSLVRYVAYDNAQGFNSIGIHSMASESGSLTWDRVTVSYDGTERLTDVIDSLVAMQTPPNPYDPPAWKIGPDRTVYLVGALSSLGPTITIDDTNTDLLRFEMQEIGTQDLSEVRVYGAHAQTVYQVYSGQSSVTVYNSERFWGSSPFAYAAGVNTLYVGHGYELIPVIYVNTTTGTLHIDSLNTDGVAHGSIAGVPDTVQAILVTKAPTGSLSVVAGVTAELSYTKRWYTAETQGWGTSPLAFQPAAYSLTHVPGQELGMLRVVTTNSQATAGGRLAVSLTAAGNRQGVYPIRRVRIFGFDRGENIAPLYEIEAGAESRYRIDSLL